MNFNQTNNNEGNVNNTLDSAPSNDLLVRAVFHALGAEIVAINNANGWNVTTPENWDGVNTQGNYKIPAILAEIHGRLSDALENFRHDKWQAFALSMAGAAKLARLMVERMEPNVWEVNLPP